MVLVVILFLDSEKKSQKMLTNPWKCVLAFVIALPAYKKKQGDKAQAGTIRIQDKSNDLPKYSIWNLKSQTGAEIAQIRHKF